MIDIDSPRAKEEQDNFPSKERDASCMALEEQTEENLTQIHTTSPETPWDFLCVKTLSSDVQGVNFSNTEGKVSLFFLKTNNSMKSLQLSEAKRRSKREDHLHKSYKLKDTEESRKTEGAK